jgi:hypothetical protein
VQRNPDARHHILDWRVPGTVDGKPFTVYGTLDWGVKRGRSRWQWLSYLAIGGFVAYLVLGRVRRR